jgi:phosphoserine phosphatase
MNTARAAILDVDGTLYPGALGVDLLGALVETGTCELRACARVYEVLTEYRRGVIDFSTMAARAYAAYAAALAGREVGRVEAVARELWASKRAQLFAFVPELLACLRARGFVPMLISGSPVEMISLVAEELGIELAHGAVFARAAGHYTGRVELSSGRPGEKLRIFTATAADRFALAQSFAIGDSLTDAALFERVASAIAFEPDGELSELARAHGWTIATRDDVIAQTHALLDSPRAPVSPRNTRSPCNPASRSHGAIATECSC